MENKCVVIVEVMSWQIQSVHESHLYSHTAVIISSHITPSTTEWFIISLYYYHKHLSTAGKKKTCCWSTAKTKGTLFGDLPTKIPWFIAASSLWWSTQLRPISALIWLDSFFLFFLHKHTALRHMSDEKFCKFHLVLNNPVEFYEHFFYFNVA